MNKNKGCDTIKKKLLLILLLVLPINVYAVYDVVDSRCTTDIKESLREEAENFTYSLSKNIEDNDVYYNLELLNIGNNIYILNPDDNTTYYDDSTIKKIIPGSIIKLYIYGSNSTYCEGYKVNTINIQVPYYNKFSTNDLCNGYESYALCLSTANLSITEEEFELRMNNYISSLNKEDIKEEETNTTNTSNSKFDIVDFIIDYNEYISGLGMILLVIYITVLIERANKKRGIL